MVDVKELRERFGLTREQFCSGFEIPYRTLQSWELGTRSCPVYVFRMMEMLLELSERSGGLEAFKRGGSEDGK
jgi:DNA-binding transcriptional regulator YiaG